MFEPSKFFAIPSAEIDGVDHHLRPFLNEFERMTSLVSADDVLSQAKSADAQLWSYFDGEFRGVMATRLHRSSLGLVCNIWVCVGFDVLEIVDGVMQEIEQWARSMGCHAIEIVGREGWEKKISGFKRKAIVLEKVLARAH